jgi:transcriptional regulator with XRE-family HTH domain
MKQQNLRKNRRLNVITITPVFVYKDCTNTWIPTDETFTREEAAQKLRISRTTLWRYESKIVAPANIPDYYRYVKAHPKELDWYCIFVISKAIMHFKGEGSYEKAAQVVKEQRLCYSRKNYDDYIEQLISKNQPIRRKAA